MDEGDPRKEMVREGREIMEQSKIGTVGRQKEEHTAKMECKGTGVAKAVLGNGRRTVSENDYSEKLMSRQGIDEVRRSMVE